MDTCIACGVWRETCHCPVVYGPWQDIHAEDEWDDELDDTAYGDEWYSEAYEDGY